MKLLRAVPLHSPAFESNAKRERMNLAKSARRPCALFAAARPTIRLLFCLTFRLVIRQAFRALALTRAQVYRTNTRSPRVASEFVGAESIAQPHEATCLERNDVEAARGLRACR